MILEYGLFIIKLYYWTSIKSIDRNTSSYEYVCGQRDVKKDKLCVMGWGVDVLVVSGGMLVRFGFLGGVNKWANGICWCAGVGCEGVDELVEFVSLIVLMVEPMGGGTGGWDWGCSVNADSGVCCLDMWLCRQY